MAFSLVNDTFHLLNPNSSTRPLVKSFFSNHPRLPCVWVEREQHPTHLETVVEWALLEKKKTLAVWGGDGTLNRVVQKLVSCDALNSIDLILFPVGTGNDLARALRLGSWMDMVQAFFSQQLAIKTLDVGVLQAGAVQRVFMNNAGFGRVPAGLTGERPHALRDILNFSPKKMSVNQHQFQALFGIIFNAPFFNGGLHFLKEATPFDGLLNAVFVSPKSSFELLLALVQGRLGRSLLKKNDSRLDDASFHLTADQDLYPQVDGELVSKTPVRDLTFGLHAKKLSLFCPSY